jgi:ComF family protein
MSLFALKSNAGKWERLIADFSCLFFPEYCLGCSGSLVHGEEILCTECILNLPRTEYFFEDENPIKEKFIGRLPILHGGAFLKFRKTGIVQHLLHQLKYNNHPEIGVRLGQLFGMDMVKRGDNDFDIIIPMPLHKLREAKRGYNQSGKFAEGLSASMQIPYGDNLVERVKNTVTQTRKTKIERWQNVADAFVVRTKAAIENKRVLLVDDIITTGASLEACGQQLLNSGCKELSIVCIAEAQ